ncbi:unnamed protein product, partial [Prorocentrum cordatum]
MYAMPQSREEPAGMSVTYAPPVYMTAPQPQTILEPAGAPLAYGAPAATMWTSPGAMETVHPGGSVQAVQRVADPVYITAPSGTATLGGTSVQYAAEPAGAAPQILQPSMPGVSRQLEAAGMQPQVSMPVQTHMSMKPPVPTPTSRDAQRGGVTTMRVPAVLTEDHQNATMTQHMPTTTAVRELGHAVYLPATVVEQEGQPEIVTVETENIVAGEISQKIVEIPTIQEIVEIHEVPEVQMVEKIQEIPQIIYEHVEHIVEQLVEVPKVIPQKRQQTREVEMVMDVPVPQIVEEIVHVPVVVNQHRHHHREIEQIVDVHVPHESEEIVHVPKIIPQERI